MINSGLGDDMDQAYSKANVAIKSREKTNLHWKRGVVFATLSFAISNVQIADRNALLFLPIIAIAYYLGKLETVFAIIASAVALAVYNYIDNVALLIGCFFFFLALLSIRLLKVSIRISLPLATLLADLLMRYLFYRGIGVTYTYNHIFVSILLSIACYCLVYYLGCLQKGHRFYSSYLITTACIVFMSGAMGIPSFGLPISIPFILIASICLLSSCLCGTGNGMLVSLLACVLLKAFAQVPDIYYAYLLSGTFAASLFSTKPKLIIILSYIAAFFAINYFLGEELLPLYALIEWGSSCLIFLLIPSTLLARLKKRIPSNEEIFIIQEKHYEKLQGKIVHRLETLQEINDRIISQVFDKSVDKAQENSIVKVCKEVCTLCPKRQVCYNSQNGILKTCQKLIYENISNDEHNYITSNCLKASILLRSCYQHRQENVLEQRYISRYNDLKGLMRDNIKGVANIVESLKTDINEAGISGSKIEQEIEKTLAQARIFPIYVKYLRDELDLITIELGIVKSFDNLAIKKVLEKVSATPLADATICRSNFDDYYQLTFQEKRDYSFLYGCGSLAKEKVCGDTYVVINSTGQMHFVISDGMGSGEKASQASKATISVLQKILEMGVKNGVAVKIINSVLKLQNLNESYATLDILSLDNHTGMACFTKTGAPPTYLFRNNKLTQISSSALPIGIVEDVEAFDYVMESEKNDLLLMASDGLNIRNEDLEDIFKSNEEANPQTLVQKILATYSESLTDDVTLIAIKVV